MRKVVKFIVTLVKDTIDDNLITHANELTYKLLLSFFPLIIFTMSLIGFLNLDINFFSEDITNAFPDEIVRIVDVFVVEVIDTRHAGVLSSSLIMTVFTASSGFNALIKGITKAYGEKETRNFVVVRLISMSLVLVFAAAVISSMLILIFGDAIYKALEKNYALNGVWQFIFGLAGYLIIMVVLLFTIILIYKFATCKKVTVYEAFPGAFTTLLFWVVSSKVFSIYINNYSRYSMVYGSIAGIIILMLWLNIISIVLLIGAEINDQLGKHRQSLWREAANGK